ncbi:helix-turn-helix transcriptional regulator [Halomonas sp. ML-15]|uniref:winged helix-turn-helix transcriptional regulator n=1 Tax=Halomonas sp. ML-15 TaxID=2773305 RepID=UPI001746AFC6|nr:helix-turn-helix domain-containing protein [Halomonas sp. ML-15]MBD3896094.1 helix-turn-helix transcriptional regulator [Halomonas sp. ML-15]
MTRTNVFQSNCPMARVTEIIGEGWTLMVLREAFLGTRHFNEFERELGIARNILADRLKKLVEAGLMERAASTTDRRVVEYRLTWSGQALFPVLIGLTQWASEHLCDGQASMRFVEKESGREVAPVGVLSADGRPLKLADIAMVAGPDADPSLGARLAKAAER